MGQSLNSRLNEDGYEPSSLVIEWQLNIMDTFEAIFHDLPFLEHQTIEQDSWSLFILSVRLEDFWKLISDESGHLRRNLFDSDGWKTLWSNQVNEQIANSLADQTDLWTFNSGVAIITSKATVLGKTMQLQDIQIIEGLQITRIIYHYFKDGSATAKDGNLLVKIIVTPDEASEQIFRATSYQGQPLTNAELQKLRNKLNSID
jgi:hypothetical protein